MWLPAAILPAWYVFSRGVKIVPHLLRRPADVVLLPAYVFVNFATGIIRIYSLLTLNRQDWITRFTAERAVKSSNLHLALAKIATFSIIIILGIAISYSRGALSF